MVGYRVGIVDAGLDAALDGLVQPGLDAWNDRALPDAVGRTRRVARRRKRTNL